MRTAAITVLLCLTSLSLFAQDDPVPLKEWTVPFEQIRGTIAETHPLRIADRALHPNPNAVPSAGTANHRS